MVFYFVNPHDIGIDGWPFASPCADILTERLASWRCSPFIQAFISEHFYYWALLHLFVSECFLIWGGRLQRHWRNFRFKWPLSPFHLLFHSLTLLSSSCLFWIFESFVAHLSSKNHTDYFACCHFFQRNDIIETHTFSLILKFLLERNPNLNWIWMISIMGKRP